MARSNELECDVEHHACVSVTSRGGRAYKFVSPGQRFVPDRIMMMPIEDPEHREIVARYLRFVELKGSRGRVHPGQLREHARMRELGYTVDVLSSYKEVYEWEKRFGPKV